jgi:hypothetical protein
MKKIYILLIVLFFIINVNVLLLADNSKLKKFITGTWCIVEIKDRTPFIKLKQDGIMEVLIPPSSSYEGTWKLGTGKNKNELTLQNNSGKVINILKISHDNIDNNKLYLVKKNGMKITLQRVETHIGKSKIPLLSADWEDTLSTKDTNPHIPSMNDDVSKPKERWFEKNLDSN